MKRQIVPSESIMTRLNNIISIKKIIVVIFVVFAIGASVHSLLLKPKTYVEGGKRYTNYNVYMIFKQSYYHLIENKDLYRSYPAEHFAHFKYSPTFPVFFGIFATLPDVVGLNLWNLLNALLLLFSIYYLPKLDSRQKGIILLASLLELLTSMQNEQSNPLMAALIILAFGLLEREKYLLATFCIVFSAYVKPFGMVGMALFLFYPHKWKLALYTMQWTIIMFLLPLIAIDFNQLRFLYSRWFDLLSMDHSLSYGLSVMGLLHAWFKVSINKQIIVLIGAAIFFMPLLRFHEYRSYPFRLLTLSSILLWMVIFNHKAESPTFIIAMAGASIWFFTNDKTVLNILLFASAYVLTSLSPTDIFPKFLREEFVKPYVLKALPCILIWLKIIIDMSLTKENIDDRHAVRHTTPDAIPG